MDDPEYLQSVIFDQYYFVRECPKLEFDPSKGERDDLKTEELKELYDYLMDLTPRLIYEMNQKGTACKIWDLSPFQEIL